MADYKEFDNVDLFEGVDAEDESLNFLENKGSNLDGIYRPKITDKTKGYKAKVRFLPNLTKEGKVGPAAIEKHQHYVDLKNNPELCKLLGKKGLHIALTTFNWGQQKKNLLEVYHSLSGGKIL